MASGVAGLTARDGCAACAITIGSCTLIPLSVRLCCSARLRHPACRLRASCASWCLCVLASRLAFRCLRLLARLPACACSVYTYTGCLFCNSYTSPGEQVGLGDLGGCTWGWCTFGGPMRILGFQSLPLTPQPSPLGAWGLGNKNSWDRLPYVAIWVKEALVKPVLKKSWRRDNGYY